MLSYPEFLAQTPIDDVRLLNLISQGQQIKFDNAPEADAMYEQLNRLEQDGLLLRFERSYERVDGVRWYLFEGIVDPVAAVYLANAASERLVLSRDPLPVV